MDDSRSTYSVLVVSAAAKFHTSLRELLPEDRYAPLCAASSVAEARRVLLERPFDIVIISAPLPDEFGTKLALHIIDKSSAGVLLLVKAEHYPDLSARLSPQGILLLQKPTSPPLLLQSLQLLCGTRERLRRMEQKTATIEEKMAEIRLVNRAKWQLIDQRGMTEQDAHRYIEKQAMDRCVTRRAVAEDSRSAALCQSFCRGGQLCPPRFLSFRRGRCPHRPAVLLLSFRASAHTGVGIRSQRGTAALTGRRDAVPYNHNHQ